MIQKFVMLLVVGVSLQFSAAANSRFFLYPFLSGWNFWEKPFLNRDASPVSEANLPAPAFFEEDAIAFSTERVGTGALLTWDLPRPDDVTSLIIEGSEDGDHYVDLESLEYTEAGVLDIFYDASPEDRRYYRLVANYKNGNQKVTPVVALAAAFSAELASSAPALLAVTAPERVEVYDLKGRLITAATPWEGKCEIALEGLEHGPYLVRSGAHRKVVFY